MIFGHAAAGAFAGITFSLCAVSVPFELKIDETRFRSISFAPLLPIYSINALSTLRRTLNYLAGVWPVACSTANNKNAPRGSSCSGKVAAAEPVSASPK